MIFRKARFLDKLLVKYMDSVITSEGVSFVDVTYDMTDEEQAYLEEIERLIMETRKVRRVTGG